MEQFWEWEGWKEWSQRINFALYRVRPHFSQITNWNADQQFMHLQKNFI